MRRLQLTTRSSSLASLVGDVIRAAGETSSAALKSIATEEIAENSPAEPSKTAVRRLERDHGMSFVPGRRVRMHNREPELVY